MNLLFYVVLPIATIIFSIALQKLLKCPILVSGIIFAIFFILTFTAFEDTTTFLLNTILYTIIAYITAYLTCLTCKIKSMEISNLNVKNIRSQNLSANNCASNNIETNTLSATSIINDSSSGCDCNNRRYARYRIR